MSFADKISSSTNNLILKLLEKKKLSSNDFKKKMKDLREDSRTIDLINKIKTKACI